MALSSRRYWADAQPQPLLRAPPFPGAKHAVISRAIHRPSAAEANPVDLRACVRALKNARVGGAFWGTQPRLDRSAPILARPNSASQAQAMLDHAADIEATERLVLWLPSSGAGQAFALSGAIPVVTDPCDPWHLFSQATALWLDIADEHLLLARIAGIPVTGFGDGLIHVIHEPGEDDEETLLQQVESHLVRQVDYIDPFSGLSCDLPSMIALLEFWRGLIDHNRPIVGAAGFAYWKKSAVEPLLWGGTDPVRFLKANDAAMRSMPDGRGLALWKSRVPQSFLRDVERRNVVVYEVEDGFIRSAGLGADCVPPLSIVIDRLGVHFDPGQPSELENLLQYGEFAPGLLERAERLLHLIVKTGVSKYGAGNVAIARPGGEKRHILVTGQVEDDRSVLCGGGEVTGNLDLLRRARAQEPDAYIIYKPHPDVEAGHRKGLIPEDQARVFADSVVRDAPISSLLDMVDAIHVLTSLAGFEALIRGKHVTTHGVPFYAGWGLTTDLGAIPARRTARRDVIEMVAAVLLLYPRYLDPVTALPCPPEVLVKRLVAGIRKENWAIVSLRRLQGSARQKLSRMGITI